MGMKDFFFPDSGNLSTSIGLSILRVGAGLRLFLKHGLEKLPGYSAIVQHFPDPIHIGAHASLAYALLTDGICSVLVILGIATRRAAVLILINLLTAFFFFVDHAASFTNGHVELAWRLPSDCRYVVHYRAPRTFKRMP